MKYKLSALFLGLTFAGVSQAGTLTFSYTLGSNIFNRTSDNSATNTFLSGDTLTTFAPTTPITFTNFATGTSVSQILYTIVINPIGIVNSGGNTITASDLLTITSPTSAPTSVAFITAAFLDSVSGNTTTTLSDTLASTQAALFTFAATGYRLTVTPLAFTTVGPTASNTPQTITVSATFALAAPEPSTWMLMGSSLIGLGLLARRRKSVSLS